MPIPIELQKYYEERFSMMATPGWLALIEDVTEMAKIADTIVGVADAKALAFAQGELSLMNWILNLKSASERAYDGLNEKDDNA